MHVDWMTATTESGDPDAWTWPGDRTYTLDPDGTILAERPAARWTDPGEPSYSARIRYYPRSQLEACLAGNPARVLNGHGLWGSPDPGICQAALAAQVRHCLGPEWWPEPLEHVLAACTTPPRLSRLDLTRSYRMPSGSEARRWIREVAGVSRSKHGGSRLYGSETAYFGQGSRRWSMKVYSKGDELQKHPPAAPDQELRRLREWADGIVRFEVTLRGMELGPLWQRWHDDPEGIDWHQTMLATWCTYYDRITWSRPGGTPMHHENLDTLPPSTRAIFEAWHGGSDPQDWLGTRAYYKHRRRILDALGIDIRQPPPDEPGTREPIAHDDPGWDPEPLDADAEHADLASLAHQYGYR